MVGKSSTNCRQIYHRAKRSIGSRSEEEGSIRVQPEFQKQANQLVNQFVKALTTGDASMLLSILAQDATLYSDGGGKVHAALNPILGGDRISRFLLSLMQKVPEGFSYALTMVNGLPGIVTYVNGLASTVLSFQLGDNQVDKVYIVVNPEKLLHVK